MNPSIKRLEEEVVTVVETPIIEQILSAPEGSIIIAKAAGFVDLLLKTGATGYLTTGRGGSTGGRWAGSYLHEQEVRDWVAYWQKTALRPGPFSYSRAGKPATFDIIYPY